MSVFDIVWIAVIILWILRSVSRASEGRAGSAGGTAELPSELGEAGEARGARQERAASRADWRERLLEAAREWELEQRRRAGEPNDVAPTRAQESGSPRLESPASAETVPWRAQEAPPPRRRSSVVIRDMTPDRTGGALVEAPASSAPIVHAAASGRRESRSDVVPEVTATPVETRRSRPAGLPSALTALERHSPLRRAILYREIFGPPKALSEVERD